MTLPEKIISGKKVGVYCLGNDGYIEWFQMFARCLRHFNPTLPLTVIPYNAEVTQLKKLATQFHFNLLPEAEVARFDALEDQVMKMGRYAGMFRKWASFFGDYDYFIFFDADIAVTMPLDEFFAALIKSDCDFVYFDPDPTHVYRLECMAELKAKSHAPDSPSFNAGAFAARKGAVTEEQLWRTAEASAPDREKFNLMHVDQPFLNYVFDMLPRRKTALSTFLPAYAPYRASDAGFHYDAVQDQMLDAAGRQMPYIHWAGCQYPTMARPEIFLKYRTLGMNSAERFRYLVDFYWRRGRRTLKNSLQKFKPTASLLALREKIKGP